MVTAEQIESTLSAYGKAWREHDEAKRRALLEIAWADDGIYHDPSADVAGRDALVAHIGEVHTGFPGAHVELTSRASAHHGMIYFSWRMVLPNGEVAIDGIDFGMIGDDGRLVRIVGFFGPPPPLESVDG